MFAWALLFLALSVVAAILGFGGLVTGPLAVCIRVTALVLHGRRPGG